MGGNDRFNSSRGEFALIGERLAGGDFRQCPVPLQHCTRGERKHWCHQNITLTTFQEFILKIAVTFSVMLHYFVNLLLFRSLMNTDGEEFWRRMQSAPPRRELYLFSTSDRI